MSRDNSLVILVGEKTGVDIQGLPVILLPALKARQQLIGNQLYPLYSTPQVFTKIGIGLSMLNSTVLCLVAVMSDSATPGSVACHAPLSSGTLQPKKLEWALRGLTHAVVTRVWEGRYFNYPNFTEYESETWRHQVKTAGYMRDKCD